jgi:hypothetical protein
MLSPVFHPNIAPHAICVGDHWSSGEPLVSIVIRIGELLAYQVYNVKSPLNGEAARWVEKNREKLPLDPVSLLVEEETRAERGQANARPAPEAKSAANPPAEPVVKRPGPSFVCPGCQKAYRFREGLVGQKLKCINCNTTFVLPTPSVE